MSKKVLNKGAHCVYSFKIHIVLVCKYRKHLLVGNIEEDAKTFIKAIAASFGGTVEEIECERNHCHVLVDLAHWQSPKVFIESVKEAVSCQMWRLHHTSLVKQIWRGRSFWSEGYFFTSTGGASTEIVAEYIRNQKLK